MTHPTWTVHAVQTATDSVIGTLHPVSALLYPVLNQEGTGSATIHVTDAIVSSLALDQYVNLTYNGNSDYGFFIEHIAQTDADGNEGAGQFITLSGPCNMGLLNDGIQPDYLTPGNEDVRHYGTNDITSTYGGAPISGGKIMWHLLDDLCNYNLNWRIPPRDAGGTYLLTWDFTDTLDSLGATWADTNDIDFRTGTPLLEILKQIAALGYDFNCKYLTSTKNFILHAYIAPFGTDRSGSIAMQVGVNCEQSVRTQDSTQLVNSLLTEFNDPDNPFVYMQDLTSMNAHRQRMGLLQANNAASSTTATTYGNKSLATSKDPQLDIKVTVYDSIGASVLSGYDLGDTVAYVNNLGYSASMRILGIQMVFPPDRDHADVTLDISTIKPLSVRTALDTRKVSLSATHSGSALFSPVNSNVWPIGKINTYVKTSDQAGTGSLINDGDLQFLAAPNAVYSIAGVFITYDATGGSISYDIVQGGGAATISFGYSALFSPNYTTEGHQTFTLHTTSAGGLAVFQWNAPVTTSLMAGSSITVTRTA